MVDLVVDLDLVVVVDVLVVVDGVVVVVGGGSPLAAANFAWAWANDIAGLGFGGIVIFERSGTILA